MNGGNMNQLPWSFGPQQFNFTEGNCAGDWKDWLRGFELFSMASDMKDDKKRDWLLHYAGPKVQSIYYNLPGTSGKKKHSGKTEYRKAVTKLTEFFAPKQNTSYERHVFRKMSQHKGERIDAFVMRLRIQADRCEFGSRIDENIKDQVTSSCFSSALRRKILERNHKSLESVMKIGRIFEAVSDQEKTFVGSAHQVDSKHEGNSMDNGSEVCHIENRKNFQRKYYDSYKPDRYNGLECSRCGLKDHKADDEMCPAKGKRCGKCGKKDHFARRCCTKISDKENLPFTRSAKHEPVRLIEDYNDYDDTF